MDIGLLPKNIQFHDGVIKKDYQKERAIEINTVTHFWTEFWVFLEMGFVGGKAHRLWESASATAKMRDVYAQNTSFSLYLGTLLSGKLDLRIGDIDRRVAETTFHQYREMSLGIYAIQGYSQDQLKEETWRVENLVEQACGVAESDQRASSVRHGRLLHLDGMLAEAESWWMRGAGSTAVILQVIISGSLRKILSALGKSL